MSESIATKHGPSQADVFAADGRILDAYATLYRQFDVKTVIDFTSFELGWNEAMKFFGAKYD